MGQIFNKMVHCAAFQSEGIKQFSLCESLGIDLRVRTDSSGQLECNVVIKSKITEWSRLVVRFGTKQFRSTLTVYVNPKIV